MAAEEPQRMTPGMRVVARGLGVFFLFAGVLKLIGLSAVDDYFEVVGLPRWAEVVAGAVEFGFGLSMFSRRTYQYGSIGIFGWMVFAALSHVMTGEQMWLLFFNAAVINLCMWLLEKDPPPFLNVRRPKRASLGRE